MVYSWNIDQVSKLVPTMGDPTNNMPLTAVHPNAHTYLFNQQHITTDQHTSPSMFARHYIISIHVMRIEMEREVIVFLT